MVHPLQDHLVRLSIQAYQGFLWALADQGILLILACLVHPSYLADRECLHCRPYQALQVFHPGLAFPEILELLVSLVVLCLQQIQ